MKVGILLLSQDDYYVDEEGDLPPRPNFDKELLLALCKGQGCLGSRKTLEGLPRSLKDTAYCYELVDDYDVNLGIKTLYTQPPHMLIVVRSDSYLYAGKLFDIENRFIEKFRSENLELWFHI